MRNILITLMLVLSIGGFSQTYPINEPFNSVAAWTCTNGSGLQTYGAGLNYLTTNIGNTPYPDGSTITMTSPVYSFTNCVGILSLTFPIRGYIEANYDYMYFEYSTNAGASWVTVVAHTGNRNNTYNYTLSNNINRFRFRLVTDGSVHSSGGSVFYYDIDYFNISCTNALPIELLYFSGEQKYCNQNIIYWATATETNNDHFEIERSSDAINFKKIKEMPGSINSLETKKYVFIDSNPESGINYYRLKQVDLDGTYKYASIVDVDNSCVKDLKIIKISNLLGQEVTEDFSGPKFIFYNDGSVVKKVGE